ncbi:MAG: putative Ig domain-containing protein [Steroidobacteraceae bacterium]
MNTTKITALLSLLLLSTAATAAANRPPTISGVPAKSVAVKQTYRFYAVAKDPDGSKVSFTIKNMPSWAWFDAKSGVLGGEPQAAGTYSNIIISASDGKASVSLPAFSITAVAATGSAPRLSGSPVGNVAPGSAYVFQPTAVDANGDALAFSISNKPSWATFSTITGRLSGAPQLRDVATYSGIVISVSDGKSVAALPAFAIVVARSSSGSVALSWTPPTANTDGSTLVNLAGYRIYHGSTANSLNQVIEVANPGIASYVVQGLPAGTHYFAVKSYSANGAESGHSAIGSKKVL